MVLRILFICKISRTPSYRNVFYSEISQHCRRHVSTRTVTARRDRKYWSRLNTQSFAFLMRWNIINEQSAEVYLICESNRKLMPLIPSDQSDDLDLCDHILRSYYSMVLYFYLFLGITMMFVIVLDRDLRVRMRNRTHRLRQPRWSCLGALLLWGSVLAISWRCRALSSWWCRRHLCRTVRTPPWIRRSVLL